MSENKKNNKNRFSVYWIYVLVGVALVAVQLIFAGGSGTELKSSKVFYNLAREGYVSHVAIINRSRVDF